MSRIVLIFGIAFFFKMIMINASNRQSNHTADQIIRNICKRFSENELYSNENKKWYVLCEEWVHKNNQVQYELDQDDIVTNGKIIKNLNRFYH
jgi:hypothetical protein